MTYKGRCQKSNKIWKRHKDYWQYSKNIKVISKYISSSDPGAFIPTLPILIEDSFRYRRT